MRMKMILAAVAVVVLALLMTGCKGGGSTSNLKQIAQQRSGDYVVTVLNDTGELKQGPNKFALEFRKASDNQLANVGNVQLNTLMPMPGMSPMSGGASAEPSGTPGRYNVESDFQMTGTWNFTVMFANGQRAIFSLKAQ